MNIWIIGHDSQPPSLGRFTRYFYFSKELNKRGHSTRIFTSSTVHGTDINVIDKNSKVNLKDSTEEGVNYTYIKTKTYLDNRVKEVFNMIEFLIKGNRFITKEKYGKPDIIIGTSPDPLAWILAHKFAKKYDAKFVAESRDLWPEAIFNATKIRENSIIGRVLVKLEKFIFEKADALIFLKEGDIEYLEEKKYLKSLGGKVEDNKFYYINNGVNIEEFRKNAIENTLLDCDLNSDKFKIIYTGSLRKVNSVGFIIDAAKELREYNDIIFLIYGTGNEVEELNMRIKNESLCNVILKGSVEKKYIPYILSQSSVNLLQYSQNLYNWSRGNSSNKLFEYFASGRPVISTVKLGYNPIAKYNCGITLKKQTVEEFKKAILTIYNLKDMDYNKMCKNSLIAAQEFDYENLTDKMEKMFNEI